MTLHAIRRWRLALLVSGVVLAGCWNGGPALYEVEGTLSYQGTPLPGVDLMLHPVAGGRGSASRTDADGKFSMWYTASEKGVVPGEQIVYVEYFPKFSQEKDSELRSMMKNVRRTYGDRKTSPYRLTIDQNIDDLKLDLP